MGINIKKAMALGLIFSMAGAQFTSFTASKQNIIFAKSKKTSTKKASKSKKTTNNTNKSAKTTSKIKNKKFDKEVTEDVYQKAISKGFLGKRYGVGKNKYVCNTFVKKALEKVANKKLKLTKGESFKNLKISTKGADDSSAPTSYDWNSYKVNISFTDSIYNKETNQVSWDTEESKSSIKKKNSGTKLSQLELGHVLAYNGHVALYFGEFEGKDAVYERLVELGVYKSTSLKKKKNKYVNKKGKTIIREYKGAGDHWRIHATNSGLLIDNSIESKSSFGTASFGKWKKSIPTGFQVVEEIDNEDKQLAQVDGNEYELVSEEKKDM